jgi:hypothetical protein
LDVRTPPDVQQTVQTRESVAAIGTSSQIEANVLSTENGVLRCGLSDCRYRTNRRLLV